MAVCLKKSFDIDKWLNEYRRQERLKKYARPNEYARQKKLALCMWYNIIIALQHEDDVIISIQKLMFAKKHGLNWYNNCFLCHLFLKFEGPLIRCTSCPLEKKYKGHASYGCAIENRVITPWARVTNFTLSKEERIAAAWEIVEAIKSV